MKYHIIFALIAVLNIISFNVYGLEERDFVFHGIKLGINEELLTEDYPEFDCKDDASNPELRRCKTGFDPTSVPGVFGALRGSTIDTTLIFHKDKLVNINIQFYRAFFKPTTQFFVKYYGDPVVTQETIKSKQGNEKANTVYLWRNGKESIVYWEINKDRYVNDNDDEYSQILFLLKE